jgi:hypothetical protein
MEQKRRIGESGDGNVQGERDADETDIGWRME